MRRDIPLDELPKYSHWVEYLLGLKDFGKTLSKDSKNITREFGEEKWGRLHSHLKSLIDPGVFEADSFFINENDQPFYSDNKVSVSPSSQVHKLYFDLILKTLSDHIHDFSQIVELGAGYGHVLLNLAQQTEFKKLKFIAGEYTQSGVDCIRLLSNRNLNIKTGLCDLNDLKLENLGPEKNSILFTSWTMAYLKGFPRQSLLEILNYGPSTVIHFEPIFEHWNDNSLLNLLWKKYVKLNDYNSTLLTDLKQFQDEGLIKIVYEEKNVFGVNPLAPISIIKWIPCN